MNWIKYSLGFVICLGLRLLPFRPPNMEPILAAAMPFSKQYGRMSGFMFGFLSIGLYDLITGKLGWWTLLTAAAYGLVGLGAALFLKNRQNIPLNYLLYSIVGTLAYDALTGLTMGPLMFDQPFMQALTGQVPFTLMHLLTNAILALPSPVPLGGQEQTARDQTKN
jgi:uncharacterized membrane protein